MSPSKRGHFSVLQNGRRCSAELMKVFFNYDIFEVPKLLPKAVLDNKWVENGGRAGDMWCVFA